MSSPVTILPKIFRWQSAKKVILRAVPRWQKVGTEKFIEEETARYICPECGNTVFRGVMRCNKCKTRLDLAWIESGCNPSPWPHDRQAVRRLCLYAIAKENENGYIN